MCSMWSRVGARAGREFLSRDVGSGRHRLTHRRQGCLQPPLRRRGIRTPCGSAGSCRPPANHALKERRGEGVVRRDADVARWDSRRALCTARCASSWAASTADTSSAMSRRTTAVGGTWDGMRMRALGSMVAPPLFSLSCPHLFQAPKTQPVIQHQQPLPAQSLVALALSSLSLPSSPAQRPSSSAFSCSSARTWSLAASSSA